ncbi:LAQU0S01e13432g1_1 [Lachancea quebecensis]|uniref:Phosphatidylinositol 4-kinase n=1 Tax=Lachancea quebecensis TaxID=1654605 RepID=A0A0P1KLD7_9SACH|nr:LAQU0S01e13432g1_1 [Lachancea quebecensis]
MAQQSNNLGNANQVVTTNTYDWLQNREQQERLSDTAQNSTAFIGTLGRWTSLVWHGGDGAPSRSALGEEYYEIQYSVFEPLRGYTEMPTLPDRDAITQHFRCVVKDCVDAITNYNIELQRISAGSSGSYFVYGTAGSQTPLGVFKPKDEEPYGPLSPKWTKWAHRTFFPCFFGRSCLIPNLGYVCESAASVLDELLGTGLVPHTDTIALMSQNFYDKRRAWFATEPRKLHKTGSFQLFVKDYVGAGEFLDKYPFPGMFRERVDNGQEKEFHWNEQTLETFRLKLEKLIILDYIMRNTDRGLDNWMIRVRKLPDNTWDLELAAIDNGLAFPWKHPDEWRSFPYGWLYLPVNILAQPFSESTRRHFLPLLTNKKWWENCHSQLREQFSRDAEFKTRMWKKQWSVLKGQAFNVVETLKNPTQGPLELVRRTRTLVIDEIMQVPSSTLPLAIIQSAMRESIPFSPSSPMVLSSLPDESANARAAKDFTLQRPKLTEHLQEAGEGGTSLTGEPREDNTKQPSNIDAQPGTAEEGTNAGIQTSYKTKKVVIERLMLVNSKPPVFTWW